jgi:biotin synthase
MNFQIKQLLEKTINGEKITVDEARFISSDSCDLEELLNCATELREHFSKNVIHRCAIVNARSGGCEENCAFCAQSRHHKTDAAAFPFLTRAKLLAEAAKAKDTGVTCFGIVTSGRAVTDKEIDVIVEVLGECLAMGFPSIGASLGILSYEQLKRLKDAGLRHYNHNLETSRSFYPSICTTHTWDDRYLTLRHAKRAGLEICSGGIFGLGESWSDRIDMGWTLSELDIRNVPLNFLSPIIGTPLADAPKIPADEGLRAIALYRFILPQAIIRICGGRPITFAGRQQDIFRAGASGILTGDYLTTTGNTFESDNSMVEKAGLRFA